MSIGREKASSIDDAAAVWAARVDRGSMVASEEAELEEWLVRDPRRVGAYARACAVLANFDRAKALGAHYDAGQFGARSPRQGLHDWRRRLRPAGWIAMAAACSALAVGLWLHLNAGNFSTQRGEVRLVSLADGSAITLNTASRVAVRFTEKLRRVELVEGEVLFNVARNPARPFIVDAGDTEVRVLGTSFTVRRVPGRPVRVLVREGIVEVKPLAAARPVLVRMPANTRLEVSSAERLPLAPASLTSGQVARELAWRDGMISLDGITLRAAAAEFARYSDVEIVIDDPAVADLTVAGLFAASNPVGFARAAAASMGLRAEIAPDSVRLYRGEAKQ